MEKDIENERFLAAREAVKYIQDGQIVGLGTGSTASYAVREIGVMVKNGLQIKGIPTSNKTKELAESLNIPIIDINTVTSIDVTIDGADEFTSDLILIKGGGGALLREKIVASMTKKEIIITDSNKKVDMVGKFKVPVEVIPFGVQYVMRQLETLGATGTIRQKDGSPFITDEGNLLIDADFGLISDPQKLAESLTGIVGIVGHGLFINLASHVIMGSGNSTILF